MISILIPEHNYICVKLVKDLQRQCAKEFEKGKSEYEIIVLDDASEKHLEENRKINDLPYCRLIESKTNLKRAKARNTLISNAKYPYIIMMDSDAEICSENFIHDYIKNIGKSDIIIGGITYDKKEPDKNKLLRWVYGKKREVRDAKTRNADPYKALQFFNFMSRKHVFEKFHFDEKFKEYGHEDTLMGFTFKQNKISIFHIDNPLIHKGLDNNSIFIKKSLNAVEQYFRNKAFKDHKAVKTVKIFRYFTYIQKLNLTGILSLIYIKCEKMFIKNLCNKRPSMFIYDIYRLSYMCNKNKQLTLKK